MRMFLRVDEWSKRQHIDKVLTVAVILLLAFALVQFVFGDWERGLAYLVSFTWGAMAVLWKSRMTIAENTARREEMHTRMMKMLKPGESYEMWDPKTKKHIIVSASYSRTDPFRLKQDWDL